MIRLTNQNWWVRMTYTLRPSWQIPERTNICSLFWRGVGVLAVEVGLAGAAGALLSYMIAYPDVVLEALTVIALVIGLGLLVLGAIWVFIFALNTSEEVVDRISSSVPAQAFKSWKEKHCALVRIEPEGKEWM